MNQYDLVRARFAPRRTDDLRPESVPAIGKVGVFRAAWIIEDGEMYAGEWAMTPDSRDASREQFGFAWAPLCDLVVLEVLGSGS